ncbi:preprotein translocase subunit SecY [Mycoplasmoides fastidiosum]|uniref:Protein translocase subunit SecY n=1 Tax=Mycoplasmoides fastidiosum TaxID=92758 RepID=A0ABU0LYE2_9BACT|nr:preprotein translocase subunit SecY [Mycoplasmoides fastidiosum]MDQ0513615.1 preprotein translocase subunit SecY [Mycoplasmoides fastidiosum]UUD37962.1 preprotein translocase subunit SecY [Mycoplasmoides fastidiosum]
MNLKPVTKSKQTSNWAKIFKNKEVLIAIASTVLLLSLFQFGAHITAPSLRLKNFGDNGPGIVGLLNLLGGGGLNRVSIFAVGISPYITAQIIIQMLSTDIIKPLAELKKSGERGRKKLELYTRLVTLPFAVATAYGALVLVSNANLSDFIVDNRIVTSLAQVPANQQVLLVILLVSGTYVALFLSDIISKKGVGNGPTLIIMSGIVSSIPQNMTSAFGFFRLRSAGDNAAFVAIATFVVYLFFYFVLLFIITFINGAIRKIPVQQTGQGLIKNVEDLPFLPIKIIPAGVIPVIFAGSLLAIPGTAAEFVRTSDPGGYQFIQTYLTLNSPVGLTIYGLLILAFSFFYSHIQVNAEELTENFEKSGRFIPGISIGQATFNHIRQIVNRVNWLGGPFLAVVAVLPNVITITTGLPANAALGGTGVIILVSGSIQFWDAIKSTSTSVYYRTQKQILQQQVISNSDVLLDEALNLEPGAKPRDYLYGQQLDRDQSDEWHLW